MSCTFKNYFFLMIVYFKIALVEIVEDAHCCCAANVTPRALACGTTASRLAPQWASMAETNYHNL